MYENIEFTKCLIPTAKDDDPLKILKLAYAYFHGVGVKQDFLLSKYFFEVAYDYDKKKASFYLGLFHYKKLIPFSSFKTAYKYFKVSSSLGNKRANLYLGIIYMKGFGVKKNFKKSELYLLNTCSADSIYSSWKLAELYFRMNEKKKMKKGIKRLKILANDNVLDAYHCLGMLYQDGVHVKKSKRKSNFYFAMSGRNIT